MKRIEKLLPKHGAELRDAAQLVGEMQGQIRQHDRTRRERQYEDRVLDARRDQLQRLNLEGDAYAWASESPGGRRPTPGT